MLLLTYQDIHFSFSSVLVSTSCSGQHLAHEAYSIALLHCASGKRSNESGSTTRLRAAEAKTIKDVETCRGVERKLLVIILCGFITMNTHYTKSFGHC